MISQVMSPIASLSPPVRIVLYLLHHSNTQKRLAYQAQTCQTQSQKEQIRNARDEILWKLNTFVVVGLLVNSPHLRNETRPLENLGADKCRNVIQIIISCLPGITSFWQKCHFLQEMSPSHLPLLGLIKSKILLV